MSFDKETAQTAIRISGTDIRKCMKCGKCSGRCPAYKDMDIKPHQFVTWIATGKAEKLLNSKAIWRCLSCMECVERCPRGVAPQAVIEAVRTVVTRQSGANGLTAEEIPPMVNDFIPQQLIVSAYRKFNK